MKLAGATLKTEGGNSFPQCVSQQTGMPSQELQVLKCYVQWKCDYSIFQEQKSIVVINTNIKMIRRLLRLPTGISFFVQPFQQSSPGFQYWPLVETQS